jgi:hypothetical protein
VVPSKITGKTDCAVEVIGDFVAATIGIKPSGREVEADIRVPTKDVHIRVVRLGFCRKRAGQHKTANKNQLFY